MMTVHTASTRTHGGNPWELMRRRDIPKESVLDFSLDINPWGFPETIRRLIRDRVDELRYYPDPEAWELRRALSAYHEVPIEMILPANGSAELIGLVLAHRPIRSVGVVAPAFTEYAWAAERRGLAVAYTLMDASNEFRLDATSEDWLALLEEADLVFLCNPNNPTGVALSRAEVLHLARRCQRLGVTLIVDEAYVEFVEQPQEVSVVSDVRDFDNLAVLRSLTKWGAVPGLRLGYLVAAAPLVETVRALQQSWPLNTFALIVGAALCAAHEELARSRPLLIQARQQVFRWLGAIPGLAPFPSAANFLLCQLTAEAPTAREVADRLADRAILIRRCDDFVGLEPGRFIRLAVKTPAENRRLVEALREVLTHAG